MLTFLFSQDGNTALDLAHNAEVTAAMVEHTGITDENKDTLLLACARSGATSLLRAVLQAGANAAHTNQRDEKTCLHYAVQHEHVDVVRVLLEAGADVAVKDKDNCAALDRATALSSEAKKAAALGALAEYSVHAAAFVGKADLVAAAIANGADVNAPHGVTRLFPSSLSLSVCI